MHRKDSRLSIYFRASFAAAAVDRTWCGVPYQKTERNIFICTASQTTTVWAVPRILSAKVSWKRWCWPHCRERSSRLEHRLDEINEIPKNERRLKSVEEHLKMLEQEEQKYQTLRRQLYEDMSSGIVSKEEYKEFSHSFNEKVEAIRKAKAEMNRQRDCLNNLDVEHLPWIEDFKSYQNLTSLNRRVLVELVESITVYDKEHIHIQYRFDQEIRNVLEYCSSVPAEETEESAV